MDEPSAWPRTLAEAARRAIEMISPEDRKIVADTTPPGCFIGWATAIRNEFGLWLGNHSLLADCGSPEMDPRDASTIIMIAAWHQLHGLPFKMAGPPKRETDQPPPPGD
jgi:hypothetical protein